MVECCLPVGEPNVLRYSGIVPEEWTCFAFGLRLTRVE